MSWLLRPDEAWAEVLNLETLGGKEYREAIAKAQLRHVAEMLDGDCEHGGVGWSKCKRYECHTCRYEMRREAGLE